MTSIKQQIRSVRKTILEISYLNHLGHIGSALSIANVLTILYEQVLNTSPKTLHNPKRDRFILSKGHAAMALYSVLYHKGFIKSDKIHDVNKDGSVLGEHNEYNPSCGIEYSGGSLGHGLSVACGMAMGLQRTFGRYKNIPRVYVLISDGELNEGSVWETIMYAPHNKVNNLCLIIDDNNSQCMGKAINIINLQPLKEKLSSFGWYAVNVNSNNYLKIKTTLKKTGKLNRPIALIIKSHIGDGISFMENDFKWHYFNLDEEKYKRSINENKKYNL